MTSNFDVPLASTLVSQAEVPGPVLGRSARASAWISQVPGPVLGFLLGFLEVPGPVLGFLRISARASAWISKAVPLSTFPTLTIKVCADSELEVCPWC